MKNARRVLALLLAVITVLTMLCAVPVYADDTDTSVSSEEVVLTGWQQIDGEWYYYSEAGEALTGWQQINGKWYYLDYQGVMLTGWFFSTNSGKWFYLDPTNGWMLTGWQKVGNYWYYMDSSGAMKTGWQKVNGSWYYMDPTCGRMLTGWQQINGLWYYMNSSGVMQTGWLQLSGKWYYLNSSGVMQVGTQTINGKLYSFNASGVMIAEGKTAAQLNSDVTVDTYTTNYTYLLNGSQHKYSVHKTSDGKYAYCLEYAQSHPRDVSMSVVDLSSSSAWTNLSSTAATGIRRATIVGIPNYRYGVSLDAGAIATQAIIAEYENGWRTSANASNIKAGLSDTRFYDMAYKYDDVWKAYSGIIKNIANYDRRPSFNGNTYNVTYNSSTKSWTYTLNDSNGILSDYVIGGISNNNASVSISGNKLTITTSEYISSLKITLNKYGTTPSSQSYGTAVALYYNSGTQELVYGTISEPVNATVSFTFSAAPAVNGTLDLYKYSARDNSRLPGAEFSIYKSSGGLYATIETDENGHAHLDGIPEDTYTIVETKAPEGFKLPSNWAQMFTVNKNHTTISFPPVMNTPLENNKGSAYFVKRESQSNTVRENAVLNIYAAEDIYDTTVSTSIPFYQTDELITSVTTYDSGFAEVKDLLFGRYYAVEQSAPDGLLLNSERHYFEVAKNVFDYEPMISVSLPSAELYDENGNIEYGNATSYQYGTITAQVENELTGFIEGAIISIYYVNPLGERALVGTGITDDNGVVTFDNVAYGLEYALVQTGNMSDEYSISEAEYIFSLNDELPNSAFVFTNELFNQGKFSAVLITIFDDPIEVTLKKIDEDTLQGLSGAVFNVYNAENILVYSGITDVHGEFNLSGISAGTYTWCECKAPPGHILNNALQTFSVNNEGSVSGSTVIANQKTIVVLHKTDLTTSEGLPNAEFEVYNSSGETVWSGTSNESGEVIIVGLNPGSYTYKETAATPGYIINTTVFHFTLNADGTVEGDTTVTNAPTKVIITKIDKDTGEKLQNAEFEFFNSAGESMGKFITNENGQIVLDKWLVGKYTYKEVTSPDRYVLSDKTYSFEIKSDGTVVGDLTVENELMSMAELPKAGKSEYIWLLTISALCLSAYFYLKKKNSKVKGEKK